MKQFVIFCLFSFPVMLILPGCEKTECCNCPQSSFGFAFEICEDTPFDESQGNPNGYSRQWESMAPSLAVDSWEGVKDKLTFSGCDCDS